MKLRAYSVMYIKRKIQIKNTKKDSLNDTHTKLYYVNHHVQSNGDHEVHTEGCSYMPNAFNRSFLGEFLTCWDGVARAKKHFKQVNGCSFCTSECHSP